MKFFIKPLIFLQLFAISDIMYGQVLSETAHFSPGTSTLLGSATRVGYDFNQWSTYYMQYGDSAYFCGLFLPSYWNYYSPSIPSYKIALPNHFIITDFKRFYSYQGFIGSYDTVGMYGLASNYLLSTEDNHFYLYTFPTVHRLKRIALAKASNISPFQTKAFAIGETDEDASPYRRSYLMEFYAEGVGALPNAPYMYAPMHFDSINNEQERVDDVIVVGNYVIFATRDTRHGYAPVNLRISDTNNVLINSDIDFQWRFFLDHSDDLFGNIRLLTLDKDNFILAYTVFNTTSNRYRLCTHKITLSDFLAGINTIISRSIRISKEYSNLVDLCYEPDVQTMILLMNGYNNSKIFHSDPFDASPYTNFYIIDHTNSCLYSIDTVGNYYMSNYDMYVVAGDSSFFHQEISNGHVIEESCLESNYIRVHLAPTPEIKYEKDAILRYVYNRTYVPYDKPAIRFNGNKTCDSYNNKSQTESEY